jgi:Protein of unknown function (DUF3039)
VSKTWFDSAACRDYPTEWWFPAGDDTEAVQRAKAICARSRRGQRPVALCGSATAYERHRREGTPVCEPCRQAWNKRQRLYRSAQGVAS